MTQRFERLSTFVGTPIAGWISARVHEFCSCQGCQQTVKPWDEVCDRCGQHAPAKVSLAAGVVLTIGLVLVGLLAGLILS